MANQTCFYLNQTKEGPIRRLVMREDERQNVFEKCHSAFYAGHCGRDKYDEQDSKALLLVRLL